jgi:hypothetical protein
MDPDMSGSNSIEDLFCALVYLMSRQSMAPQSHLRPVIADHLQWLANHHEADRYPALRDTCRRLAPYWNDDPAASPSMRPVGSHHH